MAKADPAGTYVPGPIDAGSSLEEFISWATSEFQRISAVMEVGLLRNVEILHVAPTKPREGQVTGADGTDWNPGFGAGVYVYIGGAWVPLQQEGVVPIAWTPTDASGAGLTFTGVNAFYIRIGNLVIVNGTLVYPTTVSGANAALGGFPFTTKNQASNRNGNMSYSNSGQQLFLLMDANATTAKIFSATTGATLTNANLAGATLIFQTIYFI